MIETEMADVSKSAGSKVISAGEAAALIKDGATIGSPIMGLAGWPEEIARAIAVRFEETKCPQDLTLVCGSATGKHKESMFSSGEVRRAAAATAYRTRQVTGLRQALARSALAYHDTLRLHAAAPSGRSRRFPLRKQYIP